MNSMPLCRIFCVALAAMLGSVSDINAEIPRQSKERLLESASHAILGTVHRTYERKERDDRGFEYTHGVAEVTVEQVDKGAEIKVRDRVFVRYWNKRWIGTGSPPPDHNGHWNVPQPTDSAEIYLKGDRESGYDVLSPNGFFQVTKAKSTRSNLQR